MRSTIHVLLAASLALVSSAGARAQTTQLLSHTPNAAQADNDSGANDYFGGFNYVGCTMSRNGRYVAFASAADNLVAGDTNGAWDIFLYDRQTGSVTRVSTDANGAQGNGNSIAPAISADGRYVAFHTAANNFIPGDDNNADDVVLKDVQTGSVTIVSGFPYDEFSGHSRYPAMSGDARYIAFVNNTGTPGAKWHVYVRDMQLGTIDLADLSTASVLGNDDANTATISDDGRYVGFTSLATNLGATPDGDFDPAAFLRDMSAGTTLALTSIAGLPPFVSADGRYVVYDSSDSDGSALKVMLHDIQAGTDTFIDYGAGAVISVDDHYIAYGGGIAGSNTWQVLVRNLQTGTTTPVSVGQGGVPGNHNSFPRWNAGCMSADDRYVEFFSSATNLIAGDTNGKYDVFVADLQSGTLARASVGGLGYAANGQSLDTAMSADGRYVAFTSVASNIVPGDTNAANDVFMIDRQTDSIVQVDVASDGTHGNAVGSQPAMSADGRYVAFFSYSTNLVPGDTNGKGDIFVRDLQLGVTTIVSVSSTGTQGNADSQAAVISADGRYVAFQSDASNLVPGDTNGTTDVFVRDLQTGTTTCVSVDSNGVLGNSLSEVPAISADGRYVAFESFSTNFAPNDSNGTYDVFLHDRQTGTTKLVSVTPQGAAGGSFSQSFAGSVSADGRYVAFVSYANDLVPGDTNGLTDVFVRDMVSGVTSLVDLGPNGVQSNGIFNDDVRISPDGRFVLFSSWATNLVPGDTNGASDLFMRDRVANTTERVNVTSSGAQANGAGSACSVSADGRYCAFISNATNLVPVDLNGVNDVFLRDRGAQSSFVPTCFGDGTGAACPCANTGSPGHGCQNSGSTGGASLVGSGVASLAADTVQLTSSGEMNTSSSIFLQGDAVIAAIPFGNGLRCTGGHLKRPYTLTASGGVVTAPPSGQPSFSARSAALGDTIQPGTTRIYQVYYHDPNLTFCPNGFNVSNAIVVAWGN